MGEAIVDEVGGEELPRGRVLSYITSSTTTPTRVRQVAGRALQVMAVVNIVAGIGCGILAMWVVYQTAVIHGGVARPTFAELRMAVGRLFLRDMQIPIFVGMTFVPGFIQWTMAGAVKRGDKLASEIAQASLMPTAGAMFLVTTFFCVVGLMDGAGLVAGRFSAIYSLNLIPGVAGIFFILLLIDLIGFLQWIARNPVTEKPAVAFLPRRAGL